jgi:formyl-CoA transferase
MDTALSGIRILDMTHVQAGPSASQLLAWLGADVIKLEPPGGDVTRSQLRDIPDIDSLYFTMLNCNKRSITVDMKNPAGKEVFIELLKKCDVVMENFGPGVLDRFGFHQGIWFIGRIRQTQGLRKRGPGHGGRHERHRNAGYAAIGDRCADR